MIPHLSHVMTLANSVIGVSVLAMPFCFKQCGIVLAALVLLLSSALSRLACHFLIKSAVMSRRRNFEFLAFHAFGRTGKFLVELFIIGFLLGTCIAFFVVVGDLGPEIVGKMLNKRPEDIRTSLLVTTGTFIVLPLGLLRNIDSLSSVCTATIGFYLCLVVKVIGESTRHIFLGDWYNRVMYWRPGGILQCLPIFAMALFCQTQLFDIYEAIPNVCLEKMNQVVRGALNICTMVYLCVGFFGYVAFCTQPFTGNILMSFEPSLTSDLIKMGFVFSVAFSFPLVIFPCRASLNSLLFRRAHTHEPSNYYIPEMRFRCLTVAIVAMSLGTGILIPNIEFVLGIVGSTIGVMICLIFPAAFFIAISTKNTNERLMAQAILLFGMSIMVLGTYANLYATEDPSSGRGVFIATGEPLDRMSDILPFDGLQNLPNVLPQLEKDPKIIETYKAKIDNPQQEVPQTNEKADVRREPPIPMERSILTDRPAVDGEALKIDAATLHPSIKEAFPPLDGAKASSLPLAPGKSSIAERAKIGDQQRNENLIDSDAIKKEESELAAAGDQAAIEAAARHEKLRQTLEKHKLEQLEMMQEQKELLKDIKEQKELLKDIKEQAQVIEMEKKRLAKEQSRRKDESVESVKSVNVESVKSVNVESIKSVNVESIKSVKDDVAKMENETKGAKSAVRDGESPSGSKVNSRDSRGPILNALTNWTSRRNETRAEEAKKSLEFALPIALQMRNQTNGEEKVPLRVKGKVDRVDRSALTGRGNDREDLKVKDNDREDLRVKANDREDLRAKANDREDSRLKANDREDLKVKANDRADGSSLTVKGNDHEDLTVKGKLDWVDRSSLTVKGNDQDDLMVKGKSDRDVGSPLTVKGKSDREVGSPLTVKGKSDRDVGSPLTAKGKADREVGSPLTVKGKFDREVGSPLTVKGKSDRENRSSLMVKGNDREDLTVKEKSDRIDRSSLTVKDNDREDLAIKEKSDREVGSPLTVEGNDREDGSSLAVKGKAERAAMRREILEQPEGEKREKRDVVHEEISPERKFDAPERPLEECRRKVDEVKETITNIPTTEIISIRTNVYLADQGFADKKVTIGPVESAEQASSGLSVLKKRDLKALIRERRR